MSETRKRAVVTGVALLSLAPLFARDVSNTTPIEVVDISGEAARQSVVAAGTPTFYNGHPSTVLLPDGRTLFCFWPINHGGRGGPAARSDDGGRSWVRIDDLMPKEIGRYVECPMAHRLVDKEGRARLWTWYSFMARNEQEASSKGRTPERIAAARTTAAMPSVMSEDDGRTWRAMPPLGGKFRCVLSFQGIVRLNDGSYLGVFHRGPDGCVDGGPLEVLSSTTSDGGLTWSDPKVIAAVPGLDLCEPWVFRSPDGHELAVLIRENTRKERSKVIFSRDEGASWSAPQDVPVGLTGDRHQGVVLKDGRLVVCFRDMEKGSATWGHYVAWIGPYSALHRQTSSEPYKVKLLHSYAGRDCGYSGVHLLPDGTIVCTTYIKYRNDNCRQSVVTTRFNVRETDAMRNEKRTVVWDRIDACDRYVTLHPRFGKAFEFLKRADLATLPVGRYEIEKDNCWAMVQECELTPFGDIQRPEVHRDFIDIQAPIDGSETYGLADTKGVLYQPFDEAKDIGFADVKTEPLTVQPGEFAIFFPVTGGHAPCKTLGPKTLRRKLVIKVRK